MMTIKNLTKTERYVKSLLEKIVNKNSNFKEYYDINLGNLANSTQANNLNALNQFFETINKYPTKNVSKEDIRRFLSSENFKKLSRNSKKSYLICLKKYFQYYGNGNFNNLLPKIKQESNELDKNELINRDDLDKILRCVDLQKRAMIIVNYEGALRRKELANIEFKNIQFKQGYANLFVGKSKTSKRNIPLIESIPYLREYFSMNEFEPNDKIFDFTPGYITTLYDRINKKVKKRFADYHKNLHPHLLRHSRLTELATNRQLNEPQLRKFAGWSGSSKMPAVYFHLDDSDFTNELIRKSGQKEIEKPEPETFKPTICEVCGASNPQQNSICHRCGNIFDKESFIADTYEEQKDIELLKAENKELTSDFAEILQGIKPFLAMEYEKSLDDHKVYENTAKQKAEYEKPEIDYQSLKKVMDKIDDFVKKHQKNK